MAKRFSAPNKNVGVGPATSIPRSLIVLSVVSVALFGLGLREGDAGVLHGARSVFQTVATPVRVLGSTVSSPLSGLGNVVGNLTADSATLSELQQENEQLKAEVTRLSEYESTATTLTGLLKLQDAYKLTSTAARVISQSTDSWSSTITIDKGTNAGLAVGMPVTSSTGVIGQICECSATSSVVRLVSDEDSGVSAMVQASRAQGQLVGSPDGTLRLTLVRTDQTVSVGDTIVTSGLGGVYPKGLPLGTVTNVTKTSGAMYYEITVEPIGDIENLEEVLVITSVAEDQKATSEDAQEADSQDRSNTASTDSDTQAATTDAADSGSASTDSQD